MNSSSVLISIIIPAMNEGRSISATVQAITEQLHNAHQDYEIIIVDDGSRDDTYAQICRMSQNDSRIKGIALSRNFGKESALFAGLEAARGQAIITIDADGQHPPHLIPQMLAKWHEGAQIVHAVKQDRGLESGLKNASARGITRLISYLGNIDIHNASDFKLLDRIIVDHLVLSIAERERFFRGLTSWVGFNQAYIYFDVEERAQGSSQWSFWSLLELSVTALTSFTSAPLRIITVLGFATLILGFFIAGDAIISLFNHRAVSGFATIIITLLLIGSFIMISLGIIGEYIAKIYEEIKSRPLYLKKSSVGFTQQPADKS
jgi:polyisoprenyl-phosphate glycosyltransferase